MDVIERDIVNRRGLFKTDKPASWHPLIVVAKDDNVCWAAVCTDAKHRDVFPNSVDVTSPDGGFTKNTIAICDKLGEMRLSNVRKLGGHVDVFDFARLLEAIDDNNGTDNIFEVWSV